MRNRNACLVLIAVLLAPVPTTQAEDRKPSAQAMEQHAQQRTAELRKTQAAEKAYIGKLDAAVRGAPAGDKASSERQKKLRESITKTGATLQRSLGRLDCRGTKCSVDFKLSQGASGKIRAGELYAIDEWAAWSQPCAYTMVHDPAVGDSAQVFIDCAP